MFKPEKRWQCLKYQNSDDIPTARAARENSTSNLPKTSLEPSPEEVYPLEPPRK